LTQTSIRKNDETFRSRRTVKTRLREKGIDRRVQDQNGEGGTGHRWSTVHQASRFTDLQIEHVRRNIGGRVQRAYRDLQVRGVRKQPFLSHHDRKGQYGGSW